MDNYQGRSLFHATVMWDGQIYVGVVVKTRVPGYMDVRLSDEPVPDDVIGEIERLNPNRAHFVASDDLCFSQGRAFAKIRGFTLEPLTDEERALIAAANTDVKS